MDDEKHASKPRRRVYDLAAMLAQVRPGNVHPEQDWGPAAGREAW